METFSGDGNILYLDWGVGYPGYTFVKTNQITHFTVHFTVYKLYLSFLGFVFFLVLFCFVLFFGFSRAAPPAHGDSQARSRIGAIAASLYHSHCNARSEPHLPTTPQLTATLDP